MRINSLGVQLIVKEIRDKMFPEKDEEEISNLDLEEFDDCCVNIRGQKTENKDPVHLNVPELVGENLEEHWRKLGEQISHPYSSLAKKLANLDDLPLMPKEWEFEQGWTKYNPDGTTEAVKYPEDDAIVFDVETAVKSSEYPVMAAAVGKKAWYFWVSPVFWGGENQFVPLGDDNKLVVAHYACYDIARVTESYNMELNGTRYLDTLSLHTAIEGMQSKQRPYFLKLKKESSQPYKQNYVPSWSKHTCMGSLKDLAEHHLDKKLNKETRDLFVEGSLSEIRDNFQKLAQYNALDVATTWEIFVKLFPIFLNKNPHPVTLAGILQMSREILPVPKKVWKDYKSRCEKTFKIKKQEVENQLAEIAEKIVQDWKSGELIPENDPWLRNLDWSLPSKRARKAKDKPNWYRGLLNKKNQLHITPSKQVAPYLLKMKWENFPLYHHPKKKWGYLVPIQENHVSKFNPIFLDKDLNETKESDKKEYKFFKIPHKDGDSSNVGSPLAKDYLGYFEKGILSSDFPEARKAIENTIACSYWVSVRDRVFKQFNHDGIIIPQLLTMGTITRRAVETTWLTASNPKPNKIGSEIKSTVRAPEGYKIVGADVSSQELWLAGLIGDNWKNETQNFPKIHGSTVFSFQNIKGDKKQGTDFHSSTAKIINSAISDAIGEKRASEIDFKIDRHDAKIFNYSRIYFAGVKSSVQQLKQIIKDLTDEEAFQIIKTLFHNTKGKKTFSGWKGGSECHTFNALEYIANSNEPETPLLKSKISEAVHTKYDSDNNFLTTRGNWVVQSSGVDFLHCLITATDWLCLKYGVNARLMISIHDEYRYLCKEEDVEKLAWVMQVAHLWTRAYFSYKMEIYDLPESVAWFEAIDVDNCLRKEVDTDLTTPSNPEPSVPNGYTIPPEETLSSLDSPDLTR